MTKPIAAFALVIVAGAVGASLSGCSGAHPFARTGDANSVEVVYAGDPASALPVARQHCARYERVPRLVNTGADLAVFDCVAR